ncbi:uncharacterized protein LOC128216343 [Mya arenaria]|uniref:uncharacterized protein LOC128216343 n=1 Tax=Mya arenaria TaxID=6604 RepID=UPI0022DF32C9|nr:uncharacterized protein LOC128216343 [Mya arenaria]
MATADGSNDILSKKDGQLYCEPCLNDGHRQNVEGFCLECNEYMCQPCLGMHRKLRVSKSHHVKRGEEMPTEKPNKQVQYPIQIDCNFHSNNKITSFCQSHQQLCCDQCVILGHKVCTNVKPVGDYFQEFIDSKDFKTSFETLKSLQSAYSGKMNEAKIHLEEIDWYYHNAMDKFKAELDKIKIADIEKLRAIVASYECVLFQLAAWFEDIDTCTKNKQSKELAVLMLRIKREADAIKDNVQSLCTDESFVRYAFVPDKTSLLRLVKAPFLVQTISIKHKDDANACLIEDIALLTQSLILITDFKNSSLKILNTDTATLVAYVKLQSKPWQMSITDQGEACVALNGQSKILHLTSPATDIATFREINIDGKCWAVECINKTLKVLCVSPAKLLEIDRNGKLVGIVNNDLSKETTENGEQFVTNPRCSTQDKATGSLYVSCDKKHSITEIKSDANVKLLVKSDKLNGPYGLCMDSDGSILVCSYNGKDVFRVKMDGDIQSVLLQPLDFKPIAVALDKRTKQLFVAGDCDEIHVFQI